MPRLNFTGKNKTVKRIEKIKNFDQENFLPSIFKNKIIVIKRDTRDKKFHKTPACQYFMNPNGVIKRNAEGG